LERSSKGLKVRGEVFGETLQSGGDEREYLALIDGGRGDEWRNEALWKGEDLEEQQSGEGIYEA
jgi:hypothetical protein